MFRSIAQKVGPAVTSLASRKPISAVQPRILVASSQIFRNSSTTLVLTDEQKDQEWIKFFDDPELDYFDYCRGFMSLWQEDAIPEPIIIQSALYACRRLNSVAGAVRSMEMVRLKCRDKEEIYNYIIQELGPTFEDLGLKTPEQLGLDQVSD